MNKDHAIGGAVGLGAGTPLAVIISYYTHVPPDVAISEANLIAAAVGAVGGLLWAVIAKCWKVSVPPPAQSS